MNKVVDVTMKVTVLDEDADIVKQDMLQWFRNNETRMVATTKNGGVTVGKTRSIQKWMMETLCPEDM